MKYAVIGAGGMGIQYGVLLQEFAHKDVDFIDTWKPNVEKIRELDYRPSFFAQALKRSSTGLIGVVANECRNPGAAVFIDGLAAELEKYSYRPVVGLTGLNHRKGEEMLFDGACGRRDQPAAPDPPGRGAAALRQRSCGDEHPRAAGSGLARL